MPMSSGPAGDGFLRIYRYTTGRMAFCGFCYWAKVKSFFIEKYQSYLSKVSFEKYLKTLKVSFFIGKYQSHLSKVFLKSIYKHLKSFVESINLM